MYAVAVTFEINEGAMGAFLPAMHANARASLEVEDGCLRFDVCTDKSYPAEVFLYEIYTDRAAFDAHLDSAHFKAFDAEVALLVAGKTVRTYSEVVS